MRYIFRPLVAWTGQSTPAAQRRSRWWFKASWQSTLDLLERELRQLDATNITISADFREEDLRLDGMPRAGARTPQHPGVRIAFDSKHGPLTYATDAYEIWQHNVRAIALGLEALRAVDRYGITRTGEQYKGWRQIEAPPGEPTTLEQARRLIDSYGGRAAAFKATHPDRGGDVEDYHRVQAALRILSGQGGA
jgi:hypothetical protein